MCDFNGINNQDMGLLDKSLESVKSNELDKRIFALLNDEREGVLSFGSEDYDDEDYDYDDEEDDEEEDDEEEEYEQIGYYPKEEPYIDMLDSPMRVYDSYDDGKSCDYRDFDELDMDVNPFYFD